MNAVIYEHAHVLAEHILSLKQVRGLYLDMEVDKDRDSSRGSSGRRLVGSRKPCVDTGTLTARDPICCKTRRQRLDLLPLTPLTISTRTQVDKIQCRWSFSLFLVSIIYNKGLPHIYTPTYD